MATVHRALVGTVPTASFHDAQKQVSDPLSTDEAADTREVRLHAPWVALPGGGWIRTSETGDLPV